MLLAVSAASVSAQTYQIRKDSVKTGEYSPTVYLVSVNAPQPPADEEALLEAAVLNQLAIDNAIRDYIETHHPGFQQDELPHFIFATKQNKFSFSLGGQVTLRASYDFDGISGAQDFIPATIAVPGTYATRQKFGLDGTTSRIFLKAIANSKKLGRVTLYFSTDFRGGGTNSYTPRIRSAYVSFKGFTFGRDVTTFCDLNAAPNTIDFQGPNAYNYFFSTMIRYEHSIYRDILKFGVAAELPNVSGTYGDSFASIPQRVPDFPVYMQVNWGRNKESHFRASAVFRDMYLHNESTGNNTSLFGWGVQASGNIKVAGPLQLFFNGVYGEGITPYIQDLSGIGLDFTPNPHNPRSIQTMPMYGWQAAAQIDLVPNKLAISGGYSMAEVCRRNGAYADDEYRRGQYVFGNIFWDLAPCCQLAAEYLYGTRENMDGMKGHANRVNLMVRYNFRFRGAEFFTGGCRMQPSVIFLVFAADVKAPKCFGLPGRKAMPIPLFIYRAEKFHKIRFSESTSCALDSNTGLERPISEFLPDLVTFARSIRSFWHFG